MVPSTLILKKKNSEEHSSGKVHYHLCIGVTLSSLSHLWGDTQRHNLYVHHFVINNSIVSPSRFFLSLNRLNLCHSNCHLAASVPGSLFEMQSHRPFPGPSESAFPGSLWMSMNIWTLESENVGLNLAVSGNEI